MNAMLLMPKATAVWLVENTVLTFRQIADFCNMHELEVGGIADGDVAQGIRGMDPILGGQLARDELEKAQKDPNYKMRLLKSKVDIPIGRVKKGPRYTPVSRRQDRPDAISWILKYHPELTDAQITKLIRTTKPTIAAIRDKTHWNSANLKAVDPVMVGLCSQLELDLAVRAAAKRREEMGVAPHSMPEAEETLEPTIAPPLEEVKDENVFADLPKVEEETKEVFKNKEDVFGADETPRVKREESYDAISVFAKLKEFKPNKKDEAESDT